MGPKSPRLIFKVPTKPRKNLIDMSGERGMIGSWMGEDAPRQRIACISTNSLTRSKTHSFSIDDMYATMHSSTCDCDNAYLICAPREALDSPWHRNGLPTHLSTISPINLGTRHCYEKLSSLEILTATIGKVIGACHNLETRC